MSLVVFLYRNDFDVKKKTNKEIICRGEKLFQCNIAIVHKAAGKSGQCQKEILQSIIGGVSAWISNVTVIYTTVSTATAPCSQLRQHALLGVCLTNKAIICSDRQRLTGRLTIAPRDKMLAAKGARH